MYLADRRVGRQGGSRVEGCPIELEPLSGITRLLEAATLSATWD